MRCGRCWFLVGKVKNRRGGALEVEVQKDNNNTRTLIAQQSPPTLVLDLDELSWIFDFTVLFSSSQQHFLQDLQSSLGILMSSIGGLREPLRSLCIILGNTLAVVVEETDVVM